MVAPYAGGSLPEGQMNWNDGQSRYDANAPSQFPAQDPRALPSSSRQMYAQTPPPEGIAPNHPIQEQQERARQTPQPLERKMTDRELPSLPFPPSGAERQKASSSNGGSRRPSGSRICGKCGEPLAGQFVRALDNTYHLDCFTCHVGFPVY
jgi:hypothetical protein